MGEVTKNPLLNGVSASAYIFLVASVMVFGMEKSAPSKSFLVPVAILSLFTLSSAVMAYLFGYQPAQLYFDGKKKEAVKFFLQTVGVFACITAVIFVLVFGRIFG